MNRGARIILINVSAPVRSAELARAVRTAQDRGCIVIAPAGNGGANTIHYPARLKGVISVVATDARDYPERGSNLPVGATIAAPGDRLISTIKA